MLCFSPSSASSLAQVSAVNRLPIRRWGWWWFPGLLLLLLMLQGVLKPWWWWCWCGSSSGLLLQGGVPAAGLTDELRSWRPASECPGREEADSFSSFSAAKFMKSRLTCAVLRGCRSCCTAKQTTRRHGKISYLEMDTLDERDEFRLLFTATTILCSIFILQYSDCNMDSVGIVWIHSPSLFMPAWRHLFSLQAWHWFRWALSTGHAPEPAWHLTPERHSADTWKYWKYKDFDLIGTAKGTHCIPSHL